jgi:hypothetical protein
MDALRTSRDLLIVACTSARGAWALDILRPQKRVGGLLNNRSVALNHRMVKQDVLVSGSSDRHGCCCAEWAARPARNDAIGNGVEGGVLIMRYSSICHCSSQLLRGNAACQSMAIWHADQHAYKYGKRHYRRERLDLQFCPRQYPENGFHQFVLGGCRCGWHRNSDFRQRAKRTRTDR